MQVARLIESEPTRNLAGKLRQMVHAGVLEGELSKDDILTLYLTLAPYGGNIEGIRAATPRLFRQGAGAADHRRGRAARRAAAIARSAPPRPRSRRPHKLARDLVLDRMVGEGVIALEEAECRQARADPHRAQATSRCSRRTWPKRRSPRCPTRARSISPSTAACSRRSKSSAASAPRQIDDEGLGRHRRRRPRDRRHPRLGRLGRPLQRSERRLRRHDRGRALARLDAEAADLRPRLRARPLPPRKPDRGPPDRVRRLCPGQLRRLLPRHRDHPRRRSTESLNIPAVVVLDAVGTARLIARMRRAHANPLLPDETAPGLAVGLGGVGVTLRDLVSIYAAIGRGGIAGRISATAVGSCRPIETSAAPVLDPVAAWYVADVLADVPPPLNGSPGRIAYKTGTSYGYRDAWAIGFDGKTVIGVWVGRPDGAPVPGIAGIDTAAPILFESLRSPRHARRRRSPPPRPARSSPRTPSCPLPLQRFRHPDEDMVAARRRPRDRLPRRRRRCRPRPRAGRHRAADRQDPQRRPALHLLRQRRPLRPLRLRPAGHLAPRRPRLRHALGGRCRRPLRRRDGVPQLGPVDSRALSQSTD